MGQSPFPQSLCGVPGGDIFPSFSPSSLRGKGQTGSKVDVSGRVQALGSEIPHAQGKGGVARLEFGWFLSASGAGSEIKGGQGCLLTFFLLFGKRNQNKASALPTSSLLFSLFSSSSSGAGQPQTLKLRGRVFVTSTLLPPFPWCASALRPGPCVSWERRHGFRQVMNGSSYSLP